MMDEKLSKEIIELWASDNDLQSQIIGLFEKVRDIPYGDIGSRNPEDVYHKNMGTCSGKHELLKVIYHTLGIKTKDFIALHKFKDLDIDFPANLRDFLDNSDFIDFHNFFKINVNGKWIIVDATWDRPLKKFGFLVNENWDGASDMAICVQPLEIIEVDGDPLAIKNQRISQLSERDREDRSCFISELAKWLESAR